MCQIAADCTTHRGCGLRLRSRFSVRKMRVKCAPRGVNTVSCQPAASRTVSSQFPPGGSVLEENLTARSEVNRRHKHSVNEHKDRNSELNSAGGGARRFLKVKLNSKNVFLSFLYDD